MAFTDRDTYRDLLERLRADPIPQSSTFAAFDQAVREIHPELVDSWDGLVERLRQLVGSDDERLLAELLAALQPDPVPTAPATPSPPPSATELVGYENAAAWAVSRLPGTAYYVLVDGEYRFGDLQAAGPEHWRTLADRTTTAVAAAVPWPGVIGWWCTPTGDQAARYGGDYVYAAGHTGPEGPWVDLDRAAEMMAAARTTAAVSTADSPVEQVADGIWRAPGSDTRFGFDAGGPWPYTSVETAEQESRVVDDVVAAVLRDLAGSAAVSQAERTDVRAAVKRAVLADAGHPAR